MPFCAVQHNHENSRLSLETLSLQASVIPRKLLSFEAVPYM